jgi:cell wall-associated NlpC family hydrolase
MVRMVKYGTVVLLLLFFTALSSFKESTSAALTAGSKSDSLGFSGDSLVIPLDSIVLHARSYLGTPYKYGARGPSQFDCSGYTRFVFQQVAIELPVTSRTQANEGIPIELDSARSGDLIFFTSPRSNQAVGHVGIITHRDSTGVYFIHSSSRRGVVEDKLDGYYQKRYLETRRVLVQ